MEVRVESGSSRQQVPGAVAVSSEARGGKNTLESAGFCNLRVHPE